MADKYNIGTGNWSSDTIWSTTHGGSNDTTHPVAGDTVYLDNLSGNVTIDAASACTVLDCMTAGTYAGTLAMGTQNLTVAGSVTLSNSMTITGTTGILIVNATGTLTSNGKTWPVGLQFSTASQTFTFADDWSVTGILNLASSSGVFSGQKITVAGGLAVNNSPSNTSTTTVTMTGGTWSNPGGQMKLSLEFAGNVTVNAATIGFAHGTLKYTSGTITTTGSTLYIVAGAGESVTLDTNGVTWNAVTFNTSQTVTISSLFSATTMTPGGSTNLTLAGTAGFTVGTLTLTAPPSSNKTLTLKNGVTYTVATALNIGGADGTHRWLVTSDTGAGGAKAILTVQAGASQTVSTYTAGTRIDSSAGDTIYTNGTITDCLNWEAPPVASAFMWLFS